MRRAVELECCADGFRSFSHDFYAKMPCLDTPRIETASIIFDAQFEIRRIHKQPHADTCGSSVFHNVIQGFLRDSVKRNLFVG